MKVAQVCGAGGGVGGTEEHVLDLIAGTNHVIENVLIVGDGMLKRVYKNHPCWVWYIPNTKISGHRWRRIRDAYLKAPRKIYRYWKAFRKTEVDLVHIHTADDYYYATCAAKFLGKPVIFTAHGHTALHEPYRYQKRNILYRWMHHWALQDTDRLIYVSQAAKKELQKEYHPDAYFGEVVYLSPDDREYRRVMQYRKIVGIPRVGIISRIDGVKRTDLIIKAAQILRIKGYPVYFEHYGTGDSKLIAKYQNMAFEHQVLDLVQFLGWVEEKENLYQRFDIFLVPTNAMEGFALGRLEGMKHGIPTISFNTGGGGEGIMSWEEAVAIPPTAGDLADAILRLIRDDDLRLRISEMGYIAAHEKFSYNSMIDRFLNIYADEYVRTV